MWTAEIGQVLVCTTPVAPLRAEASEKSELETQLLYGEECVIVEIGADDWLLVETNLDQYQAWCDKKHLEPTKNSDRSNLLMEPVALVQTEGLPVYLPYGSRLTAEEYASINGQSSVGKKIDTLANEAYKFLHAPYLWGGRTILGIDCSAYMQLIFNSIGHQLPRNAFQQYEIVDMVSFEDRQANDLAFFYNKNGRIIHVGLLLDQNDIIHASGDVHIDSLTSEGIVRRVDGRLTHQLASIGRISGKTT